MIDLMARNDGCPQGNDGESVLTIGQGADSIDSLGFDIGARSDSSDVKLPAVVPEQSVVYQSMVHNMERHGSADGLFSLGIDGSRTSSGEHPGHPNIFVRGLPLSWGEEEITTIFETHGTLTSLRLVRHSVTKLSLGYGFVRFQDPESAQSAIEGLNGVTIAGHSLQVKFADADAGPPSSGNSGLVPCDSCYVKHLPVVFGVTHIRELFGMHGQVEDVKLFPCLDQFRGASALVRMDCIDSAIRAISALNGIKPQGSLYALIVRFAESSAEKAARLSRKEKRQGPHITASRTTRETLQVQQALAMLSMAAPEYAEDDRRNMLLSSCDTPPVTKPSMHQMGSLDAPLASLYGQDRKYRPRPQSIASDCAINSDVNNSPGSIIEVSGLPDNADRLWLYEKFSRYGPVFKVILQAHPRIGTVMYGSPLAAVTAAIAMHGDPNNGNEPLRVYVKDPAAGMANATSIV